MKITVMSGAATATVSMKRRHRYNRHSLLLLVDSLLLTTFQTANAFPIASSLPPFSYRTTGTTAKQSQSLHHQLHLSRNNVDENNNNNNDNLDDLEHPLFNLRKESLLFDDTATTKRSNNIRRLWIFCKEHLPRVVHGAPTTATVRSGDSKSAEDAAAAAAAIVDNNPMGALLNMAFIRIPAIAAGLLYALNVSHGHPLVVDLGNGPFAMNPAIVGAVLYLLLL